MTEVTHCFRDLEIRRGGLGDLSFMLANKKGGYSYFGEKPASRYHGMFCFAGSRMVRVVEDISAGEGPVLSIRNDFLGIERKRRDATEYFFMPHGYSSLVYGLDRKTGVRIFLDMKESYDNREWGRNYEILNEKDCIIIKFTKKTDGREDDSHGKPEFVMHLAIMHGGKDFHRIEKWVERDYFLDRNRKSHPFSRHVFEALWLNSAKIVFSADPDIKTAIAECGYVFRNSGNLLDTQKKQMEKMYFSSSKKNTFFQMGLPDDVRMAYICAINSLDALLVRNRIGGQFIQAGLPWFFREWSRDELISLKALKYFGREKESGQILNALISKIGDDSRIISEKGGILGSSDAIGWMFLRFRELDKGFMNSAIARKLKRITERLIESHTENCFAISAPKETWMDSIERSGSRIEIQALRLATYNFMYRLTGQDHYAELESELKKKVLERMWDGEFLFDGLNDASVRPNVFIAHYAYPQLLSNAEWVKCFDKVIGALWLGWGGFSTIDGHDPHFRGNHSGQDPDSYHNGDSWFWINNLAALALFKVDRKKYRNNIERILKSSTEDILFRGAISHHSELSSAETQTSEGCPMQAWSSAMYIELISGMFM